MAEAPAPRQVDARQPELIAWDAWDDARPDAAEAAALRRELRLASAVAAGKLAVPALGAPQKDGERLQSELPAAPEAALEQAAPEPYTPVADRFAERSCGAEALQEQWAWEEPPSLPAHPPKPQDALAEERTLPADVSASPKTLTRKAAHSQAMAVRPQVAEQSWKRESRLRQAREIPSPASPAEEQPWSGGSPLQEAQPQSFPPLQAAPLMAQRAELSQAEAQVASAEVLPPFPSAG